MTGAAKLTGGCLCGAVRFTAAPAKHEYTACFCDMCRRWSAGPFMGIPCGDTVELTGSGEVAAYKSSAWAERHFCPSCGTTLFYAVPKISHKQVSIEAFDDTLDFRLVRQIFIDEKPDHYSLANDTPKMTGAEVKAAFFATQAEGKPQP